MSKDGMIITSINHNKKSCPVVPRTITLLLIYVAVGCIFSIGIAWLLFVSVDITSDWENPPQVFSTAQNGPAWDYDVVHRNSFIWIHSCMFPEDESSDELIKKAPQWSGVSKTPNFVDLQSPHIILWEEAWGWPMVCMMSRLKFDWSYVSTKIVFGIPLKTQNSELLTGPRLLPTRPIWVGFLVNTIIYTIISWIAVMFYTRLRNTIRRKRGFCQYCRYNIANLSVCPECGTEVNARTKTFFEI